MCSTNRRFIFNHINDKDFIQLQHYGNVYQFSPLLKSFIGEQLDNQSIFKRTNN